MTKQSIISTVLPTACQTWIALPLGTYLVLRSQ